MNDLLAPGTPREALRAALRALLPLYEAAQQWDRAMPYLMTPEERALHEALRKTEVHFSAGQSSPAAGSGIGREEE